VDFVPAGSTTPVNGPRLPTAFGFRNDDTEVIAALGTGPGEVDSHLFNLTLRGRLIQVGENTKSKSRPTSRGSGKRTQDRTPLVSEEVQERRRKQMMEIHELLRMESFNDFQRAVADKLAQELKTNHLAMEAWKQKRQR
jgi:hypothetical protein